MSSSQSTSWTSCPRVLARYGSLVSLCLSRFLLLRFPRSEARVVMSTTFFAFTPNGYLYNSPAARTQSTLPDAVALRLENSQPKVAQVYHAAFADNGAYFLSYLAAEAGKYQFFGIEHRGLSASLLDWIGQYPNFKRDIPSLRVVFGAYGQYFAWDKHGHHPGALLPVIAHSIQQDGGATANPPRILALGPGGSYLVIKSRGEYYYDLLGCSKEADDWLDKLCQIESYPQGRPGALNELIVSFCHLNVNNKPRLCKLTIIRTLVSQPRSLAIFTVFGKTAPLSPPCLQNGTKCSNRQPQRSKNIYRLSPRHLRIQAQLLTKQKPRSVLLRFDLAQSARYHLTHCTVNLLLWLLHSPSIPRS